MATSIPDDESYFKKVILTSIQYIRGIIKKGIFKTVTFFIDYSRSL